MIIQIQPWIDNAEMDELKRVVSSTFVTEHALTKEFEDRLKLLTKAKYVIAMTNGTLALYACLKSLNIGPGDEVIVPDMTFIATANAVILAGATPVLCDISEDSFCIDVASARSKVTERTKAIIPVHLYGQSADMDQVLSLARERDIHVIEDAAQGVGVTHHGIHVGTFGALGILSFYGNKTITCGEGGAVLTNDEALALACYRLKNHGRDKKGVFIHDHIGFNFSFTEMQAAVGVAQMKKLPQIIKRKKYIHERYLHELADISSITPCPVDSRTEPVYWFTSFLVQDLEKLASHLLGRDIQTRRFFYPLHLQPCYQKSGIIKKLDPAEFPVSRKIYGKGLSLPSSYTMTDEEQSTVIREIRGFYQGMRS